MFYRAIPEGKELTFKDKDAWRENWMDRHHLRYGRILTAVEKKRFNEEWAKSRLLLSPESQYRQELIERAKEEKLAKRREQDVKSAAKKASMEAAYTRVIRIMDKLLEEDPDGLGLEKGELQEQWESEIGEFVAEYGGRVENYAFPAKYKRVDDQILLSIGN